MRNLKLLHQIPFVFCAIWILSHHVLVFWSIPANLWSADTSIIQCQKSTAIPITVAPASNALKHCEAARLTHGGAEANFLKFKLSHKGTHLITHHKHCHCFPWRVTLRVLIFENMPAQYLSLNPRARLSVILSKKCVTLQGRAQGQKGSSQLAQDSNNHKRAFPREPASIHPKCKYLLLKHVELGVRT